MPFTARETRHSRRAGAFLDFVRVLDDLHLAWNDGTLISKVQVT
jgi:hypothetical protein